MHGSRLRRLGQRLRGPQVSDVVLSIVQAGLFFKMCTPLEELVRSIFSGIQIMRARCGHDLGPVLDGTGTVDRKAHSE